MNYEKMWNNLKDKIRTDIKDTEARKRMRLYNTDSCTPIDILECNIDIIKCNEILTQMINIEIEENKNE